MVSSFGKACASVSISSNRPPCHDLSAVARAAVTFCCSAVTSGASAAVSATARMRRLMRRNIFTGVYDGGLGLAAWDLRIADLRTVISGKPQAPSLKPLIQRPPGKEHHGD